MNTTNKETVKRNNYNPKFEQNTGIHKKLVAICKQNSPKLLSVLKKLQTNRRKKARETIKETSTRVRPERVNKWPNAILARL